MGVFVGRVWLGGFAPSACIGVRRNRYGGCRNGGGYDRRKINSLLRDPGIIRNRLKVEGAIKNARAYLAFREQYGRFGDFLWDFVDGEPVIHRYRSMKQLPATTPQSDAMARALKQHGFTFVGSTICYAMMQSVGMVNDHLVQCFRHQEVIVS